MLPQSKRDIDKIAYSSSTRPTFSRKAIFGRAAKTCEKTFYLFSADSQMYLPTSKIALAFSVRLKKFISEVH